MSHNLAYETAVRLNAVLKLTTSGDSGTPALRFPPYRSGKPRVSEQEARVLMCQVLEADGRRYSIEYPTKELYAFSGRVAMSARTDLVVWGDEHPELAVEFKAGQPPQSAVDKDMEKVVLEQVPALWFHTLHGANSATLPSVFKKLSVGLVNGVSRAKRTDCALSHELTVAVVVLLGKHAGLWTQTVLVPGLLNVDPAAWHHHLL